MEVESPTIANYENEPEIAVGLQPGESRRDRWSSRVSFILAAVGSAIGLGNFWRFPYLLYKHGGGVFLIPYVIALFTIGIPMLQLEITLGQIIQQGSVKALSAVSPKMCGVGAAGALAAFLIVSYYSMIISWVLSYFFQSFRSNLPWEGQAPCLMNNKTIPRAEYYLYREVLGVWKEEEINNTKVCRFRDGDESDGIQWETFGYMILTWACIYFCVFKGAHHTSKVVYLTVLLPVVILLVLFFRAITLEGAQMGIDAYIVNWNFSKLKESDIWVDAVSQIFFSLSVASGVMISFGSYNKREKPVLADTFIIALSNSVFSFISGFVVMSTLGFYAHSQGTTIEELPPGNLASLGLVFVTYPTALSELGGTQFWCIILFLNLFMLGIDSAFSLVEGYHTCVADTFIGQKIPRPLLIILTILPCMLLGLFYCQDTGLYWFDAVDHYVQYIMLLVGATQCYAIGWMRGTQEVEDVLNTISSYYYTFGYTIGSIALIALTVLTASSFRTEEELNEPTGGRVSYEILIGFIGFLFVITIFWYLSQRNSNCNFSNWLNIVSFSGSMTIVEYWMVFSGTYHIQLQEVIPLGRGNSSKDNLMNIYGKFWCFMTKYVIPISILLLLFVGIRKDILFPYSNYLDRYQNIGWIVFIVGVCLIIFPLFFFSFRPYMGNAMENPLEVEHNASGDLEGKEFKIRTST